MGYVPGFKNDVFVSYPRENNRADPGGGQWVREFCRCLETALNQRIPSTDHPTIFFDDHDFQGGHHSDILLEEARRSALLLAVVSPPYVAAGKFTLRELNAFCESRPVDDRIILSVYFLPIENEDRPPELQGPKRYEFYWMNESNVPVPLTSRADHVDEYFSKVHTVAQHLKNRLDEMRRRHGAGVNGGERTGPFALKTVLLGRVTDDLVDTSDEIREYIEKLGANVLPKTEHRPWRADFKEDFEVLLAKCDLFVQLLSKVRSEKRDEDHVSCAEYQITAAIRADKQCMKWRHPSDISRVHHYDRPILESASAMGLEQFKIAIRKKLERLIEPQFGNINPTASAIARGDNPFIYITADKADLNRALELKAVANTVGAVKIMDDENRLKDFKEQIEEAEAVVFLYGDAPRKFVDDWLAKYLKLKMTRLRKAPRVEVVYYAPPPKTETERKLRTGWRGLRELGSQESFTPEDIREIFAELRNGSP